MTQRGRTAVMRPTFLLLFLSDVVRLPIFWSFHRHIHVTSINLTFLLSTGILALLTSLLHHGSGWWWHFCVVSYFLLMSGKTKFTQKFLFYLGSVNVTKLESREETLHIDILKNLVKLVVSSWTGSRYALVPLSLSWWQVLGTRSGRRGRNSAPSEANWKATIHWNWKVEHQTLFWLTLTKWTYKKWSRTHLYASSETLMRPFVPVVSVRLVKFTVFPNKQYLGILCPITPVTTSPEWIPIVIFYEIKTI